MQSPHVTNRSVPRSIIRAALVVFGLLAWTGSGVAQTAADSSPVSSLKQMSLDELVDIEVTSVSKRPEKLLEAASAIQVITGEDIRRSGASSIPEALRLADNLNVAQQNSHDWNISARGFNTDLANKLLVLIDGRAVYTPLFSGVFWDAQDYLLEDIDRIEVISGPGGALWGANAVNGVINVTTKSSKDTQGLYLEAGGGTELRASTGVRYGGTYAPGGYFTGYGMYFRRRPGGLGTGEGCPKPWRIGRGGVPSAPLALPQKLATLQGGFFLRRRNVCTRGPVEVR